MTMKTMKNACMLIEIAGTVVLATLGIVQTVRLNNEHKKRKQLEMLLRESEEELSADAD